MIKLKRNLETNKPCRISDFASLAGDSRNYEKLVIEKIATLNIGNDFEVNELSYYISGENVIIEIAGMYPTKAYIHHIILTTKLMDGVLYIEKYDGFMEINFKA